MFLRLADTPSCPPWKRAACRPRTNPFATGFNARHFHAFVTEEWIEEPDGIASAADARDEKIREPLVALQHLASSFIANDAMEIAHHHGIWMRSRKRCPARSGSSARWSPNPAWLR